jgi:ribosomal protein S28E/S33
MKDFIDCLFDGDLKEAKDMLVDRIEELINEKLNQLEVEILDEANIQKMGRTKLIRVRIRKGKTQRRIKKSAVPGYTIRGGKLIRMLPTERRHRKMAARRAKFKRRSKMKQSIRKRVISLRKRKALGLQ